MCFHCIASEHAIKHMAVCFHFIASEHAVRHGCVFSLYC